MGDLVLAKDHKLSSLLKGRYYRMELLCKGPFKISSQFGDHTYELVNLQNDRKEDRYHKQMLRPYKVKEQTQAR